jgi:hypothetical protein
MAKDAQGRPIPVFVPPPPDPPEATPPARTPAQRASLENDVSMLKDLVASLIIRVAKLERDSVDSVPPA